MSPPAAPPSDAWRDTGQPVTAWALTLTRNPTVVRLDASLELTRATIETCPPRVPPHPIGRLLELPGIRSIDLHRYRARLNLLPGFDPDALARGVSEFLAGEWGPASSTVDDPPRAFPVRHRDSRLVAESLEMAGSHPTLRALFGVDGVAEVILEPGRVRVRLGRLFSWADVEEDVRTALKEAGESSL
jgi:hypothetical protein